MKFILLKTAILAFSFATCGIFGFTTLHKENFAENSLFFEKKQENPRGTVDRNGVKYKWEIEKKGTPGTYQLKIVKEHKGQSNLVYSTDMVHEGNTLKIFLAKQNGYKWDIDRTSFLLTTYSGSSASVTAEGKMKTMAEASFGITEAQLKSRNLPKKNGLYDLAKYAATHLVFKYKKALKP
jgi:hypothetical protein